MPTVQATEPDTKSRPRLQEGEPVDEEAALVGHVRHREQRRELRHEALHVKRFARRDNVLHGTDQHPRGIGTQ